MSRCNKKYKETFSQNEAAFGMIHGSNELEILLQISP